MNRFYQHISKNKKSLCAHTYFGKVMIRECMCAAFKRMRTSNWDKIFPHILRGIFISKLINDPSVNISERMVASQHNSVSASKVYQKLSFTSETNCLSALVIPKQITNISHCDVKIPPKTTQPPIEEINYKSYLIAPTLSVSNSIHRYRPFEKGIFTPSTEKLVTPSTTFASILSAKVEEEKKYLIYTYNEANKLEEGIKQANKRKMKPVNPYHSCHANEITHIPSGC